MRKGSVLIRSLIGEIIARFEKRGFKLAALKLNQPSQEQLEKHYADLKDKPFFPSLIKYSECLFWDADHHPFGVDHSIVHRPIFAVLRPRTPLNR